MVGVPIKILWTVGGAPYTSLAEELARSSLNAM